MVAEQERAANWSRENDFPGGQQHQRMIAWSAHPLLYQAVPSCILSNDADIIQVASQQPCLDCSKEQDHKYLQNGVNEDFGFCLLQIAVHCLLSFFVYLM